MLLYNERVNGKHTVEMAEGQRSDSSSTTHCEAYHGSPAGDIEAASGHRITVDDIQSRGPQCAINTSVEPPAPPLSPQKGEALDTGEVDVDVLSLNATPFWGE